MHSTFRTNEPMLEGLDVGRGDGTCVGMRNYDEVRTFASNKLDMMLWT